MVARLSSQMPGLQLLYFFAIGCHMMTLRLHLLMHVVESDGSAIMALTSAALCRKSLVGCGCGAAGGGRPGRR